MIFYENRDKLVEFLDEYLKVKEITDSSYNGLQVEGKNEIRKIAFAVDSGIEVFEKAKAAGADMLVVHHGIFWEGVDPRFIGVNKRRLDVLLSANINLYAVHLPLDMHPQVGNNVELLKLVGAAPCGSFLKYKNNMIGSFGKFSSPQKVSDIVKIIDKKLKTSSHVLSVSEDKDVDRCRRVSIVAAVSGGIGLDVLNDAKQIGADLLIVGERRDFYHLAGDLGISVILAGHHASEQTGIKALQKLTEEKFPNIESIYIECPTGL